jgi:hypothetical protein
VVEGIDAHVRLQFSVISDLDVLGRNGDGGIELSGRVAVAYDVHQLLATREVRSERLRPVMHRWLLRTPQRCLSGPYRASAGRATPESAPRFHAAHAASPY